MRFMLSIPITALALIAPFGVQLQPGVQPISQAAQTAVDCQASLNELTADPHWFDDLINPVIESQPELNARLDRYSRVQDCLAQESGTRSSELENVDTLLRYFLVFVGGADTDSYATRLTPVLLSSSADPAVRQLRDEVGIAPPRGYIYVRNYRSRDSMPDLVRAHFRNPAIQGVTILDRYVAVLSDNLATPSPLVSRTISHELVHAYVNSAMGPTGFQAQPNWYAEGIAAHFSGSSEPTCVYTLSETRELVGQCETATANYEQYAENFDYLQAALGSTRFNAVLRKSVEEQNPGLVLSEVGIASEAELAAKTQEWHEQRNKTDALRFLVGGIGAIALLVVLIIFFYGFRWLGSLGLWERPPIWRREPSVVPTDARQLLREQASARAGPRPLPRPSTGMLPVSRPLPAKPADAMPPRPAPTIPSAPVARQSIAARHSTAPRQFTSEEAARTKSFWDGLPNFPQLLGSARRLETVMNTRAQAGAAEWRLAHQCPRCQRHSVLLLPNDVSYQQYAEGIRSWAVANRRQPPAVNVIMQPYAICLCCGTMFWASATGIPRPPMPIRCE